MPCRRGCVSGSNSRGLPALSRSSLCAPRRRSNWRRRSVWERHPRAARARSRAVRAARRRPPTRDRRRSRGNRGRGESSADHASRRGPRAALTNRHVDRRATHRTAPFARARGFRRRRSALALGEPEASAPVVWLGSAQGWLVTGHDLAVRVMCNPELFTVADPRFSTAHVIGPSMVSLDGLDHLRQREPFAEQLRRREIQDWVASVTVATADSLIAPSPAAGPRRCARIRRSRSGGRDRFATGVDGASAGDPDGLVHGDRSGGRGLHGRCAAQHGQRGGAAGPQSERRARDRSAPKRVDPASRSPRF